MWPAFFASRQPDRVRHKTAIGALAGVLAAVALALFWRLGRGKRGVPDPQRAPLQSMSRGVFDRDTAVRVRS